MATTTTKPTPTSTFSLSPQTLTTTLLTNADLQNSPTLSSTLTTLINHSYNNITPISPSRWDLKNTGTRLKTPTAIHELLGATGLLCAVSTQQAPQEIIACAAATPWKGGMDGVVSAEEKNRDDKEERDLHWEFVAIATQPGLRGNGVSRTCVEALVQGLVQREKKRGNGKRKLKLWAHVVEEMNGGYYRRLGWRVVRSFEKEAGFWGSLYACTMLIMLREVEVGVDVQVAIEAESAAEIEATAVEVDTKDQETIIPPTPVKAPPSSVSGYPIIYTSTDLRTSPLLAANLTAFINLGYNNLNKNILSRWERSDADRLSTPEEVHGVIGSEGLFSVMYTSPTTDIKTEYASGAGRNAKEDVMVACAAASPWHADMDGVIASPEESIEGLNWEVKTVTTRPGVRGKGMAARAVDALIVALVERERKRGEANVEPRSNDRAVMNIWVHAVEEMNGEYWTRRGWTTVRSIARPIGYWGSKFGFELLVMLKRVDVETGKVIG